MTEIRRRGRPATFDREAALEAAVALFWQHGYEGTSIAMLTEAMGVTAPTLYAAFGSKEALYCDALGRYQQREAQAIAQELGEAGTLGRMVEGFLRASAARFTAGDGPKGCMVAVGSLQHGPDGQAAADATAQARAIALERFVAAVDGAKAGGELPPDTDSAALARFYTAVAQGMSAQAADGADVQALNAVIDLALKAWPAPRS